jgi:hypothetical protein
MACRSFEYVQLAQVKGVFHEFQVCVQWKPGEPAVCYAVADAVVLAEHADRMGKHALARELRHYSALALQQGNKADLGMAKIVSHQSEADRECKDTS